MQHRIQQLREQLVRMVTQKLPCLSPPAASGKHFQSFPACLTLCSQTAIQ